MPHSNPGLGGLVKNINLHAISGQTIMGSVLPVESIATNSFNNQMLDALGNITIELKIMNKQLYHITDENIKKEEDVV